MAAQRPAASANWPELSVASTSGVSVTSNVAVVSTFTWVAHARSVGVGVGAAAEASVQFNGVESAMMSIEPETGLPPPSPGLLVACETRNVNNPLLEIGQLQHSANSWSALQT